MAAMGGLLGSVAGMFLLTRLTLWIFKKLGDNERRIFAATATTYVIAIVIRGLSDAYDGSPKFAHAALVYSIPAILWLVVDLLSLKGRRAKAQLTTKPTVHKDYSDAPVQRPGEELDEDERNA